MRTHTRRWVLALLLLAPTVALVRGGDAGELTEDPTAAPVPSVSEHLITADDGRVIASAWRNFGQMHERYLEAFIAGEGFGLRRVRTMDDPERRILSIDGAMVRVKRASLVGLLLAPDPRVYVYGQPGQGISDSNARTFLSPGLNPTKSIARENAPTRPLDEFERDALRQLQAGAEVVFEDMARIGDRPPRAMGAMRARDDCLACHTVARGELLGVMLYEFRPVP